MKNIANNATFSLRCIFAFGFDVFHNLKFLDSGQVYIIHKVAPRNYRYALYATP